MSLCNWMNAYQNRVLATLTLPGAHDAGTIDQHVNFTKAGTQKNSITQGVRLVEQLIAGTRFFDLRLKEHDGEIVAHHTTGGQGAYGTVNLAKMIEEAANFTRTYAGEVVIIRISHTNTATNAHQIVQQVGGNQLSRCTGNLCSKTLQQIRTNNNGGGLVVLFSEGAKMKRKISKGFKKVESHSQNFGVGGANVIDQRNGIHSFTKYNGAANFFGIATCGCYEATNALHEVMSNALKGQFEHVQEHDPQDQSHLWQVYWQKTYINPAHRGGIEAGTRKRAFIKPNGKVTGGTHAATSHMIQLMQGHGRHLQFGEDYVVRKANKDTGAEAVMYSTSNIRQHMLPNIISYDFVNEETNRKIIALNSPNGQIVQDQAGEADRVRNIGWNINPIAQ